MPSHLLNGLLLPFLVQTLRLPGPRSRLAVLICGLQDRLLLQSKLQHVIARAAADGHEVDIYIEVVRSGVQEGGGFSSVPGEIPSPEAEDLEASLSRRIASAGGRLAHCRVLSAPEQVTTPVTTPSHRLSKYPPLTDPVGRNVLRRYQTVERLMSLAKARGPYDLVLWTRDDDHWLGPLDLQGFLADPYAAQRLYSKGCLTWDGVNDKTLLLGWAAAKKLLARLSSDFWLPEPRLERTANAETFLQAFAELHGVEPVAVPFAQLPTADSVYVRNASGAPALCQKEKYLCSGLPASYERPRVCGEEQAKSVLAVVNYWSYPEAARREPRALALDRTLRALAALPLRRRVLLVTNEHAPEADGLVAEQVLRPLPRCSPTMQDPLCMAWEAMRVLRNESTGASEDCDLWRHGACGELRYDYYLYLEGDIELPAATFDFWARHVDGLFRQAHVLVPHREEPFEGTWKLTECVRNKLVDHLEDTHVLRDAKGADELYPDPHDRVYLRPPVPYSACLFLSRWQFEVYRQGNAWDFQRVDMPGGKIREAAIRGLLADSRLSKVKAVTHVRLPVLHQQHMTGNVGLYPDMCGVEEYAAKALRCAAEPRTCPVL